MIQARIDDIAIIGLDATDVLKLRSGVPIFPVVIELSGPGVKRVAVVYGTTERLLVDDLRSLLGIEPV